jgi:hypothetical protein
MRGITEETLLMAKLGVLIVIIEEFRMLVLVEMLLLSLTLSLLPYTDEEECTEGG